MPEVSYTVTLDGSPLPPEVQGTLQHLQVEDHSTMADILRLRAQVAPKANDAGWSVLDDNLFPRLSNIKVKVAIGGSNFALIDSYVVETRVELSNTPGKSFIDVLAMDPTVLMSLDQKQRSWPNMSDSDIANAIFGDYGFTPDIEEAKLRYEENDVTTTQFDTDIKFLRKLANRNGFECFVDVDDSGTKTGHFHKPRVDEKPQGVLSVASGAATNVNLFKARFEMLKPVEAVAAGLDVATQENQDGKATESSVKTMGGAAAVTENRPRRIFVTGTGLSKASELAAYAQSMVDEAAFAITAEGELNTVAYGSLLRAKKSVLVRGVSREFSGVYYVDKVMHTFTGAGYSQKFKLRRNALGLGGRENFAEDNALPS